jgi:hypothetical protein
MLGYTFRASPVPHSETVQTCRAGQGSTAAAASCCVSFVDNFDGSAGVLALITQHPPELAPATVKNGLGHSCPRQLRAAHIANVDVLILHFVAQLSGGSKHPCFSIVPSRQKAARAVRGGGRLFARRARRPCRSRKMRRTRCWPRAAGAEPSRSQHCPLSVRNGCLSRRSSPQARWSQSVRQWRVTPCARRCGSPPGSPPRERRRFPSTPRHAREWSPAIPVEPTTTHALRGEYWVRFEGLP